MTTGREMIVWRPPMLSFQERLMFDEAREEGQIGFRRQMELLEAALLRSLNIPPALFDGDTNFSSWASRRS